MSGHAVESSDPQGRWCPQKAQSQLRPGDEGDSDASHQVCCSRRFQWEGALGTGQVRAHGNKEETHRHR